MKKMILSAVMLVFAASGRAQEAGAASPTEHNEWLTTFEAVAVDADLDIKFVKVPDTEVKDKTLRISERPDSRRPDRTEVTVYYNTLQSVSLSGAAAVFEGTVDAVQLDLTLGRKASLTAAFDVKDLRMELTGGSSATLTGKASYLTLFASTGRVAASGLEVMSAEVNAQSKADVSLWITDRFIGKTTTNARITYKGQPAVVRGGAKFMGGEISHVE